ncbi:MAG: CBS domain-containing protein, partial [Candidatus Omnitrophota bacterium]
MKENIRNLLINKDISIKEAMRKMGEGAEKILFIADDNLRLLGSLTDGDIRTWILADKPLTNKVERVFNKNPIFVKEDCPLDTVKKLMLNEKIEWVPAVNNSGKIVDVYLWEDVFGNAQKREKKN